MAKKVKAKGAKARKLDALFAKLEQVNFAVPEASGERPVELIAEVNTARFKRVILRPHQVVLVKTDDTEVIIGTTRSRDLWNAIWSNAYETDQDFAAVDELSADLET